MGAMAVTLEFLTQMASNAENISIKWRHHVQDTQLSVMVAVTCCYPGYFNSRAASNQYITMKDKQIAFVTACGISALWNVRKSKYSLVFQTINPVTHS